MEFLFLFSRRSFRYVRPGLRFHDVSESSFSLLTLELFLCFPLFSFLFSFFPPLSHHLKRLPLFCFGQALPNNCELCNGTFNCFVAFPLAYGTTPCELRQFALVFQAHDGCQGGLFQETSLQVYDEAVSDFPDTPTFNVHVLPSSNDTQPYKNCSVAMPNPIKSFYQQSCTGFQDIDIGLRDPVPNGASRGPVFVVECFSPNGCWIRLRYRNKCTLKGTGAFSIGIIGVILCSIVVLGCITLALYFIKHLRFVTSEMWVQLFGIGLITVLNVAFWSCFIITSVFVFPYWYTRPFALWNISQDLYFVYTNTLFWIDKIVLILSCLLHLGFLHQLVSAVHADRKDLVLVIFGVVVGLLLASIGLAISYYTEKTLTYHLVAFFSITYGFHIVQSIIFLIYGLILLQNHWRVHGLDRKSVKTIVLLVLLVLPNVGRLIVVIFSWLRHLLVNDSKAVYFAGFDYYLVAFSSHSSARLFYIFGFLIPDTIPYVVLLLLLFDSVHEGAVAEEKRQSEMGAPLLERTSNVPSRYEV